MAKFLLLICLLLPAAQAVECPTALNTFHIYGRSSQNYGCLDHWQKTLFAELGCPLNFIEGNPAIPKKEALLAANKIQLVTGLAKAPYRNFHFSQPIVANRSFLYRRVDDPHWDQITGWCDATMQQATIIGNADVYAGEYVARLRADKTCSKWFIETPRGLLQSFSLLDAKRADLLISPELFVRRMPEKQRQQYKALSLPVDAGYLHIAFSAAAPASFIETVNQFIEQKRAGQTTLCDMDLVSAPAN